MEHDEQKKEPSREIDLLPPEIRDEYQEVTRNHRKLLKRLAER